MKAVVAALGRLAKSKGSNIFSQKEITDVYVGLRLPPLSSTKRSNRVSRPLSSAFGDQGVAAIDVESIIDVMRSECYIISKGPRLFQLQIY